MQRIRNTLLPQTLACLNPKPHVRCDGQPGFLDPTPKDEVPVPCSFLHVLSVSAWLFCAYYWIHDCNDLASASFHSAGMQAYINCICEEVSTVPRLQESRHQLRGCFSRTGGSASSWENPSSGCFRKRLTCQVSV